MVLKEAEVDQSIAVVDRLSAVRLTRLPGYARPEKNGFQHLLYLAPNPPFARLIDLPTARTRAEMLQRWRDLCPRWNPEMEPYQ